MRKLINKLYFFCLIALLVFLAHFCLSSIFIGESFGVKMSPIIITLICIIQLFAVRRLHRAINISPKKINICAISICVIAFALLAFSGFSYFGRSTVDLVNLESEAANLVNSNEIADDEYFSIYHNNIPSLYLLTYIFKLASHLNMPPLNLTIIISAAFIAVSFYLCFEIGKLLGSPKSALVTLILLATNPVFYLFVSYFYTDIMIMPFLCGAALVIVRIAKCKLPIRQLLLHYFLLGLLFVLNMKIRASSIVLFAAFAFYVLAHQINKRRLLGMLAAALGAASALGFCGIAASPFVLEYDKEASFPAVQWIAMGLNPETGGAWSKDDYDATKNSATHTEKTKNSLKRIKERLLEMTPSEYLSFIASKNKFTWAHGSHAYLNYTGIVHDINSGTDWIQGDRKFALFYVMQGWNVLLMLGLGLRVFFALINPKRKVNTLIMTVLGAFVFYSLWESAPKYSLNFIPLFSCLAFSRLDFDLSKLKQLKISLPKAHDFALKNTTSALRYVVFFTTAILLLGSFYKLCIKPTYSSRQSANSFADACMTETTLPAKSRLRQSFEANLAFNTIYIRPSTSEFDNSKSFTANLLDSNGRILNKSTLNTANRTGADFIEISMPEIMPAGDYFLLIESNEELRLSSVGKQNIDFYSEGELTVGDAPSSEDLQLRAVLIDYAPLISKKLYLAASVAIITFSAWALNIRIKK